jgi:hypothetical protein
MASDRPILVVATTPGPAQALAGAIQRLAASAPVVVLSSRDAKFGRGIDSLARFNIDALAVEDLLPGYQPLQVSEDQARALLARIHPRALLAGAVNEPTGALRPLEDSLCAVATADGLMNAQFVEGWDVWQPRSWGPPPAGTYLAVDEFAAQVLAANGVKPDHIRVVGYSPSLLNPSRLDRTERARVRAELDLSDDQRLVVCFGQVTSRNPVTLGWAARAVGPHDRLVFQRHPRDQRTQDQLLAECPAGVVEFCDLPTHRLIHATDLCLTHFSLVSFTACALGIPTILTLLDEDVAHLRRILGKYPTTLLSGTTECYDYHDLAEALARPIAPAPTFLAQVHASVSAFPQSIAAILLEQT